MARGRALPRPWPPILSCPAAGCATPLPPVPRPYAVRRPVRTKQAHLGRCVARKFASAPGQGPERASARAVTRVWQGRADGRPSERLHHAPRRAARAGGSGAGRKQEALKVCDRHDVAARGVGVEAVDRARLLQQHLRGEAGPTFAAAAAARARELAA
jgi:hypothetical protein